MFGTRRSLIALIGGVASVVATDIVYVSDLQIFTVLVGRFGLFCDDGAWNVYELPVSTR